MLDGTDATGSASETATPKNDEKPATPGAPKIRAKAAKSDIGFPYVHLEEALVVPKAIFDHGGVPCSRDQLAVAMKMSAGSGGFSLKVGAAKTFGLIDN